MSEPLTIAGGAASASIGVTFATTFPEATPSVMLCALAGAAIYVVTSEPHKVWKQVIFAVISFMLGVFLAVPTSKIIAGVINTALGMLNPPVVIEISPNVGALVSAMVSIGILLRILKRSKTGSLPGVESEK